MPSSTFKKGGFNQRERVSLIAEIILEGALRIMESNNKEDNIENIQDSRQHDRKINDAEKTVSQIYVNPG